MARVKKKAPNAPIRSRRRLSARGRQRFGEFVANGLLGAAALVGSSVLLPGFTGSSSVGEPVLVATAGAFVVCIAAAVLIRYMTEEREGERT
jgi:hypothetical protein